LTINGQYFSDNSRYPLVVNIDNEPCTILSVNLTTIRCQTSPTSIANRTHYHGEIFIESNVYFCLSIFIGGLGFHVFSENVFVDLVCDKYHFIYFD
jgi:hypothetical protein